MENEVNLLFEKIFGENLNIKTLSTLVSLQGASNPDTVLGNFDKNLTFLMQEFQNKTLKQETKRAVSESKMLLKFLSINTSMQSALNAYQNILWYSKFSEKCPQTREFAVLLMCKRQIRYL